MPDAHANFAVSLVATAPSPATSGTSLVVTAGEGTRFPAVPFNATICPAGTLPTPANAEIVRVTARSTDTLTITRAQESSSARTVVVGDQIAATVTAKTLTDVETNVDNVAPSTQAFGDAAAAGSSSIFARRDHKHAMPADPFAAGTTTFTRTVLDDASSAAAVVTLGADRSTRAMSFLANVIAESCRRDEVAANNSVISSGRLQAQLVPVLAGDVITNVAFFQSTTAFTAATNAWFAITDSALNVIRQSTDQLTAGIAQNTVKVLAVDSIPVTAGARVASSTVTLTIPTLSESLTSLVAAGDSIVVSNANIAAYNGTFTVVTVGATTITYVSGGSASDSLVAPFPTVRLAAGKRTYTVPTSGYVYAVIMLKGTVGTHQGPTVSAIAIQAPPVYCGLGATGLTGTCPSPITVGNSGTLAMWAGLS